MDSGWDRESSEERFRQLVASSAAAAADAVPNAADDRFRQTASQDRLPQTASSESPQRFIKDDRGSVSSPYHPTRSTSHLDRGGFDGGRANPDPFGRGGGGGGGSRGFSGPISPTPPSWYSRPLGASSSQIGGGIDYSQALGLEPPLHNPANFPPNPAFTTPGPAFATSGPTFGTPPPRSSATPSSDYGRGAFYSERGSHNLRRSPSRDSLSSTGDFHNMNTEGRASPALSVASSSGYRSFIQEQPGGGGGGGDGYRLPPPGEPSFLPPHSSPYDPRRSAGTPSSSAYAMNTSYDELRNVDGGQSRFTPVNSFRPVTPPHPSSFNPSSTPKKRESVDPMVGAAVQFASLFAENLLSHPCVVLRRQCQVNHRSRLYHVTPFAIIRVIANLQRYQGLSTFWKGIGSTFMCKGLYLVSEQVISELTPFRRDISYENSTMKQLSGHVGLKALSFVLVTPFFSAALVESVQSDIASERPGIFDCVREGSFRLLGYGMPQSTRLFPVWHLVLPTVLHGTLHYVLAALTQWGVVSFLKRQQEDSPRIVTPTPRYATEQGFVIEHPETNETATMVETFYREVMGAFCGHLLADALLYPLETVLHRLHLQGTRTIIDDLDSGLSVLPITTRYDGVFDCFRCIVREEGRLGLLKGFGALLIQYSIHFALIKVTKLLLDQVAELSRSSEREKRPL